MISLMQEAVKHDGHPDADDAQDAEPSKVDRYYSPMAMIHCARTINLSR